MKKLFSFIVAALCATTMFAATQYCHELLTSGDKSIYLTCEKLSEGSYQLTVEGENLKGFGGSFFNPGEVDLRTTITSSTAEKIVCSIAAESDPKFYTPLYVMMPGEVQFAWPNDVEWGTCGEQVEDNVKPVMGNASLASVTYNTAVINVAGTDKETEDGADVAVTRFKVVYGETSKTYTATDGQITITNLTPGTAYSFTIYAVDAAGNVSEDGLTVEATTSADAPIISGTCSGKRSDKLDGSDFTNPYNYTFTTSGYEDNASVLVEFTFNDTKEGVVAYLWMSHSGFQEKQMAYDDNTKKASYTIENLKKDDVIKVAVKFAYSGGMSVTSYIDYTVGTSCEAVVDNIMPTMGKASLASVTHNSAVINVEGTDKKTADGEDVPVSLFQVVYGDTTNVFAAVDGKITITGLAQNTTYNLAISAVDLAGNVSADAKTVVVTTDKHLYAPEDVPAAPVHEASKVLSIYSDTYTSNGYTHGEWEGGSLMTEKEIDGNHYNLYTFGEAGNGNYFGLEFGKEIDVTNMKKLHLDIWSEVDIQELKVTPIWKEATGGVNGTEISQTIALEGQKWNSIDVTLADLVGVATWQFVYQIKLFGMARYVLALDNIYFWTDGISTLLEEQEVAPKVSKTIENGQVVIIREGVRYNVMGNVIR